MLQEHLFLQLFLEHNLGPKSHKSEGPLMSIFNSSFSEIVLKPDAYHPICHLDAVIWMQYIATQVGKTIYKWNSHFGKFRKADIK